MVADTGPLLSGLRPPGGLKGMRILHIVAGLPPGGGISESVPVLCRHLRQLGHEVTLVTLDGPMSEAALAAEQAGVRLVRFTPSWPRFLCFSWQMAFRLSGMVGGVDVVHVHSNWTFPVWWGCCCALRAHKPLMMSPRGCLAPERLRRSAWRKVLASYFFDRRCLRKASVIHATCEDERRNIEDYLAWNETPRPMLTVVPNGIDVYARAYVPNRVSVERLWPACRGKRIVLFLGRIDPIKGLDLLVDAFQSVASHNTDWHLLLAGPDENGYSVNVHKMIDQAGLGGQMTLCGPVYGADRLTLLQTCDLFVLPTRNENFGLVVGEALACGVPVITTKGAPWSELLGYPKEGGLKTKAGSDVESASGLSSSSFSSAGRCGWWVDIGVEPLAEALGEAMSLTDSERREMGENGRRLVETKYRWDAVAERMAEVYNGVAVEKGRNEVGYGEIKAP